MHSQLIVIIMVLKLYCAFVLLSDVSKEQQCASSKQPLFANTHNCCLILPSVAGCYLIPRQWAASHSACPTPTTLLFFPTLLFLICPSANKHWQIWCLYLKHLLTSCLCFFFLLGLFLFCGVEGQRCYFSCVFLLPVFSSFSSCSIFTQVPPL